MFCDMLCVFIRGYGAAVMNREGRLGFSGEGGRGKMVKKDL